MKEVDDKFFSAYQSVHGKVEEQGGIPNLEMNRPLATNTLKGTIGLELEIEGRNLVRDAGLAEVYSPITKAYWQAVNDGSLRGEAKEYILTHPVQSGEVKGMLDGLFAAFERTGSVINNSNRCSTHVHVNVSGKTVNHITAILLVWAMFEEALISWCGEERKTNHFCLSFKETRSTAEAWEAFLSTGSRRLFERNLKYSAFNILPIFDKGSVEFRCGPSAEDANTPRIWATFLDRLVAYACEQYRNPQRVAFDLSERGASAIFADLCGDAFEEFRTAVVTSAGGVEAFEASVMAGFRRVQNLSLGFPWNEWLTLIEREYIPNPFGDTKPKKARRVDPMQHFDRIAEWANAAPRQYLHNDIRVNGIPRGREGDLLADRAGRRYVYSERLSWMNEREYRDTFPGNVYYPDRPQDMAPMQGEDIELEA